MWLAIKSSYFLLYFIVELYAFLSQLPYGTMQDNEMRSLRVKDLQDDGFIFLWVTGR